MIRLHADSARFRAVAAATLVSLALSGPAQAGISGQIVLDQQPTRHGGPFSDTLYMFQFQQRMQRIAEDVTFAETTTIGGVNWWGFYDQDNPPAHEEMRIRFYSARPGDGLPGDVLAEYLNPAVQRSATGHQVLLGIAPDEYFYQVELETHYAFPSMTTVWVEIAQIGDLSTGFRWEDGVTGGGVHAFINPAFGPDWQYSASRSNRSLQLIAIPEPTGLVIVSFGLLMRRAAQRRTAQTESGL